MLTGLDLVGTVEHDGVQLAVVVEHLVDLDDLPITVVELREPSVRESLGGETLNGWLDAAGCLHRARDMAAALDGRPSAPEPEWTRYQGVGRVCGYGPTLTRTETGYPEVVVEADDTGRVLAIRVDAATTRAEHRAVTWWLDGHGLDGAAMASPAAELAATLERQLAMILGQPVEARVEVVTPAPTRAWRRLTVQGTGPVAVTWEPASPTTDGLVDVRYDLLGDRPAQEHIAITVTAEVTAPEQAALEALLRRFWRDGHGRLGPVIGLGGNPHLTCRHGETPPGGHRGHCVLRSLDLLVSAIRVEVGTKLADTANHGSPTTPTSSRPRISSSRGRPQRRQVASDQRKQSMRPYFPYFPD